MARNMPESEDDFIQMQQDAIRRVRDMQNRARRTLEDAGLRIDSDDGPTERPTPAAPSAPQPPIPMPGANRQPDEPFTAASRGGGQNQSRSAGPFEPQRPAGPPSGHTAHAMSPPALLQQLMNGGLNIPETVNLPVLNISLDRDQIMLVIMLYILIQDKADPWLILALAYIMFL